MCATKSACIKGCRDQKFRDQRLQGSKVQGSKAAGIKCCRDEEKEHRIFILGVLAAISLYIKNLILFQNSLNRQ
jgi:hypothetical protein